MKEIALYTQAYNSEEYIEKCIKSILNQTYKAFTYYIIDNGSRDKTWEIINKYAQKDSRIIPIHMEENTRHVLEKYIFLAHKNQQDYFAILDSDDWYEPTFIEKMLKTMIETNADLVSCASTIVFENNNPVKIKRPSDKLLIVENKDFSLTFPYLYIYYGAMWGRLYKTSIFVENNLLGNRNIKYGADTEYVLNYQKYCKRVVFHPEALHNYYIRASSTSFKFNEKSLSSSINFYTSLYSYLEKINGLNSMNLTFISLVYLTLITNTQINPIISQECAYEQKFHILKNLFYSEVTQESWNRLNNADEKLKKTLDINNNLTTYKRVFMNYIYTGYNKKYNNEFYEMICFLMPLFREISDKEDVKDWLKDIDFLKSLMNLERNEVFLKLLSTSKNSAYLPKEWKALKKLISNNILLNWIDSKKFVTEYPDIVKDVYLNKFPAALEKTIDVLRGECIIPFEEEMIFMCLNISALLEDGDQFVYAKKLQTQFFIQQKRLEEATLALNDLLEMCPNDNEVFKIKERMDGKNV